MFILIEMQNKSERLETMLHETLLFWTFNRPDDPFLVLRTTERKFQNQAFTGVTIFFRKTSSDA